MDALSQSPPDYGLVHCHKCSVLTLQDRDRQLAEGKKISEIVIIPPNVAYTWEPQISGGMVTTVPTCLGHMAYKDERLLRG